MKITSLVMPNAGEIIRKLNMILPGHFVLRGGEHSLWYFAKEILTAHPFILSRFCHYLAMQFIRCRIDTVVCPAVIGGAVSDSLAMQFSLLYGREVHAVIADKDGGNFTIGRNYGRFVRRRRVFLGDDVVTKGSSLEALKEAVVKAKGQVVAGGVLIDRGGEVTAKTLGLSHFASVAQLHLPTFASGARTCPGCRKDIPYSETHGHSRKK